MPCMKIVFCAHDISRKCVQKKIVNLIKEKSANAMLLVHLLTLVKIFRIVPEFRILGLTFIRKSASKY